MIIDEKFLKSMDLVIKARNGKREIHTVVYVDSTIVDTLIARGKIEGVNSVQFFERRTEDSGWWYCRRAEVDDLVDHLRRIKSEYWRLF